MKIKEIVICLLIIMCMGFTSSDKNKAIQFYKSKDGIVRENKNGIYVVDLSKTPSVIDSDLQYLTIFTELTILHLEEVSITSKGLTYITGLKKLEVLTLRGTKVDDVGMKYLKGLVSLQELDLVNTKVTDEGIQELAGLENLRMLKLRGSKVTQKGIDKLKKKLPDCYITLETDEEIQ